MATIENYTKTQSDVRLYVRSMGKLLEVIAIRPNDNEANDYMARHDEAAVVACIGTTVIIADRFDQGVKIP